MTAFVLFSLLVGCGLENLKVGDSGSSEPVDPDTLDEGGDSDGADTDGDEDSDDGGGPSDVDGGSDDGGSDDGGSDDGGSTTGSTTGGVETGDASDGDADGGGTTGSSTSSGTSGGSEGGSSDGGDATGASSTDGGDDDGVVDGLGGCDFDGECTDGLAIGECTGFGGVWLADGCPTECRDFEFIPGSPIEIDPSDSVYTDDLDPSCNLSPSPDVGYFWIPPSPREYCISATVNEAYASTSIAPVLSVWSADCEAELHCSHADFTDDAPEAYVRGIFSEGEPYIISIEHDLAHEVGLFDLKIEMCD